ncbi:MAG: hypothetical protein ABUT20_28240 [Bacteroidota bacterium]
MTIKAIVFKTALLNETRAFFETKLGLALDESSAQHFVLHCGGLRIAFIQSAGDPETEIYLEGGSAEDIRKLRDPNGINIIIRNSKK